MAIRNAATSEQYARIPPDGSDITDTFLFAATAANAVNGDVIRLSKLGAGTIIPDVQVATDAANAAATLSLGWAYVDGSASAPAEVLNAASVATAGVVRANATGARTIPVKDAYLILTVGGATFTNPTNIRVRPTIQNRGTL